MVSTFAIICDDGYGLHRQGMIPVDFVEAKTAMEARKIFKLKWAGHWCLNSNFRATKTRGTK